MTPQDRRPWLAAGVSAASVLVLVIAVAAVLDQQRIDDDAYMFVRYARNMAASGRLAWNPGGPPVYGLTSLGYFAVVFLLHVTARVDPAFVLILATLLCGAAFVALAAAMGARAAASGGPRAFAWSTAAALAGVGLAANALAPHFVSGMDTAFTLAAVTVVLTCALAAQRTASWRAAVIWGTTGGALLWVRPDTLVFGLGLPCMVAVWGAGGTRRAAFRAAVVAAATTILLGLAAWLLLGSPVPLAVYAKVLHGYGDDMRQVYAGVAGRELGAFLRTNLLLVAPAVAGLVLRLRTRGVRDAAFDLGLLITIVVFLVFHRFFVLPIMGDRQRFELPALPPLLLLAIHGAQQLAALPAGAGPRGRRLLWGATAAVLVALVLPAARNAAHVARSPRPSGFSVLAHYRDDWPARMWLRLDRVAELPDDIVIATTEVGHPGVLNPGKTIVDLAGLNDPEFARYGFSAERLFARPWPDLFYITSRHYAAIRLALLQDPRFAAAYEVRAVPGGLAVALHRDGRHYRELRAALGGF